MKKFMVVLVLMLGFSSMVSANRISIDGKYLKVTAREGTASLVFVTSKEAATEFTLPDFAPWVVPVIVNDQWLYVGCDKNGVLTLFPQEQGKGEAVAWTVKRFRVYDEQWTLGDKLITIEHSCFDDDVAYYRARGGDVDGNFEG